MDRSDSPSSVGKTSKLFLGGALIVASIVVFYFTSNFILQAFRGPRVIAEQELLRMAEVSSGENYVSYTPSRPATDSNLVWGVKDNAGTKFLLIPVGDQAMLCTARIADNGPTYVGRLQVPGGVEREAIDRIRGEKPQLVERLTPHMLQAVRSIWFDTAVALAGIVLLAGGGLRVLLRPTPAAQRFTVEQ